MQTAPVAEIQKEVEGFLSRADLQDLQPLVGQLASTLVTRSLADPASYAPSTLAQLVHTQCLCHRSVGHSDGSGVIFFFFFWTVKCKITAFVLCLMNALCHYLFNSVCPELVLLALERKDYFLCQLCLQFFPDIPEAVTCACLKAFIR